MTSVTTEEEANQLIQQYRQEKQEIATDQTALNNSRFMGRISQEKFDRETQKLEERREAVDQKFSEAAGNYKIKLRV